MSFTLKAAQGKDFINREDLIKEMFKNLKSSGIKVGYALIGMRRIGKTSIFLELERRLRRFRGVVPIYFSVWDLIENTVEEFNRKCYSAIMEAFKREISFKYKVKNLLKVATDKIVYFLKTLDISIKLFDEIEIAINQKNYSKEDIFDLFEKIFLLPDELSKVTKTKCIFFIDEFPSIMDLKISNGRCLGESVLKKIRGINERYRYTTLNISGSLRTTMNITVLNSASPFYRQFEIIKVGPFSMESVKLLLEKNLSKRINRDVSDSLYYLSGGIPFYVQAIGKNLLLKKKITPSAVEELFKKFIDEDGNIIFREELNRLSSVEKRIILKMAKEDLSRVSDISRAINESMNVTGRFLEYLMNKGVVFKEKKGVYKIEDRVFREWLRYQE